MHTYIAECMYVLPKASFNDADGLSSSLWAKSRKWPPPAAVINRRRRSDSQRKTAWLPMLKDCARTQRRRFYTQSGMKTREYRKRALAALHEQEEVFPAFAPDRIWWDLALLFWTSVQLSAPPDGLLEASSSHQTLRSYPGRRRAIHPRQTAGALEA